MKKRTPVDLHLTAAQCPVRPQQEVVPEYLKLKCAQGSLADEIEIANIILVEPDENHLPVLAPAGRQGDLAHELFLLDAVPESRVTGAKDSAQNAIARCRAALADRSLPFALAIDAEFFCQRYCFRSIPIHIVKAPS